MGYDVFGSIFVLLATVILISQSSLTRAWGFAVMMIGNVFWHLFGYQVYSTAMTWTSLVFMVLNCYGMAYNILCAKGK